MRVGDWDWIDLTVQDADTRSRFYEKVCGWKRDAQDMSDHHDFNMDTADGTSVAGMCHARGENAGLPDQWVPYVVVSHLQSANDAAEAEGGSVMQRRTRLAFLRDPGGVLFGVWEEEGADVT